MYITNVKYRSYNRKCPVPFCRLCTDVHIICSVHFAVCPVHCTLNTVQYSVQLGLYSQKCAMSSPLFPIVHYMSSDVLLMKVANVMFSSQELGIT